MLLSVLKQVKKREADDLESDFQSSCRKAKSFTSWNLGTVIALWRLIFSNKINPLQGKCESLCKKIKNKKREKKIQSC